MIFERDKLLSELSLSRWLGVPRDWVREQTDAGNLPCVRAGRRVFYSSVAVEQAIRGMARRLGVESGGGRR